MYDFLVPAQKDNKIGSFKRWEQAFRAYATIYCGAHPHRLKEIWQYITVITPASSILSYPILFQKYQFANSFYFIFYILDDIRGTDLLWFIGDNFVAKSYRKHFKKMRFLDSIRTEQIETRQNQYFIKENFEFAAHCNSKFSSSQVNLLARLQNTMAMAINSTNKNGQLPKYVVIVLDDDMISYLNFQKEDGIAMLLGTWVEWLAKEYESLLKTRISQLPLKCKVRLFMYWVATPTHSYSSKERNQSRIKFNLSLESVIRAKENMRVIRIKDIWNSKDSTLVMNDRITETGMSRYWTAIDASVRYNALRRESYVARKTGNVNDCRTDEDNKINVDSMKSDLGRSQGVDPMVRFFRRNRYEQNVDPRMVDREDWHNTLHWHSGERFSHERRRNFDRFILPRPRF